MFATLGLILGLGLGAKPLPIDHLRLYRALHREDPARVSVWLNKTNPYSRGDHARVYVSADQDAYLTVLRIDTDGRVRILFPQDPWDDNWVPGGRSFEVEDRDGGQAFRIDDAPGAGFIFAIASPEKFDYSPILTERDHWDYRLIADGQVRGDPYVAVTDLAEQITDSIGGYDYDLAQYDVEQHYDYPRFVCYDCHAYAPYYAWNPYGHTCVRFRVVIYDDPYYYPYRYYGGRRVVSVRPRRPQARYVFVDNDGRRDYVTRIQNRPRREEQGGGGGEDQIRPRRDEQGSGGGEDELRPRRGEDVGGRGSIPTPGLQDRRRTTGGGTTKPGTEGRRPETPNQPRRQGTSGGAEPIKRPPTEQQPERRRTEDRQAPPGMVPMKQPPRAEPRSEDPKPQEPRREEPKHEEPQSRPQAEPRRQEPQSQPQAEPRRQEPQSQPRAEPRRQDPPAQRAEPRRSSGGGSKPSSGPELRRRRG